MTPEFPYVTGVSSTRRRVESGKITGRNRRAAEVLEAPRRLLISPLALTHKETQ